MTYLSRLKVVQNTRRLSSSCVQFSAGGINDNGLSNGLSFGSSISTLSCKYSTVLVSEPMIGHAFEISPFPI